MRGPFEGLDATAEAELAMDEVEPASAPDLDTMRRALRELEAAKVRVERDAERAANELREKLVLELLPLLDNLDRTIRSAEAARDSPAVVQGVRLVRSQFANVLATYGLERLDAAGQRFDPRVHDAVGVVPVADPAAHERVVDEIAPGYRFGERLLRPARVIVGKHAPRFH